MGLLLLYSVRGILIHAEPSIAVVECGGVGFRLNISLYTQQRLPRLMSEVTLFTYMAVKEDAITLYGFADMAEQDSFKKLTTVKGVGAKVALAILSELSPEKLSLAISAGDAKAVARASGVGTKLAQRILLELKDKFGFTTEDGYVLTPDSPGAEPSARRDAVSALVALGYSQSESAVAVAKCPDELSAEDMIRTALRGFAAKM